MAEDYQQEGAGHSGENKLATKMTQSEGNHEIKGIQLGQEIFRWRKEAGNLIPQQDEGCAIGRSCLLLALQPVWMPFQEGQVERSKDI